MEELGAQAACSQGGWWAACGCGVGPIVKPKLEAVL
jgi:hypothetical protein